MKNEDTKDVNEIYFVMKDNGICTARLEKFGSLKGAADYYYSRSQHHFGASKKVLVKKIGFTTELDKQNGMYKINPVGDIISNNPYYLINELRGECGYSVKPLKDLNELARLHCVPDPDDDTKHIAHGIEELKVFES